MLNHTVRERGRSQSHDQAVLELLSRVGDHTLMMVVVMVTMMMVVTVMMLGMLMVVMVMLMVVMVMASCGMQHAGVALRVQERVARSRELGGAVLQQEADMVVKCEPDHCGLEGLQEEQEQQEVRYTAITHTAITHTAITHTAITHCHHTHCHHILPTSLL